jgi:hypothetical protein
MYEGDDMNFTLTSLVGLMILFQVVSRRGNKPFETSECLMRKPDENALDVRRKMTISIKELN